jgi:Uma2 family endonuclease
VTFHHVTRRLLTAEGFYRLPDDDMRSELVAGEVIREPPPGPQHGLLAMSLGYHLRRFVEAHPLGRILGESGYVLARGPDTVRGPDVSFISEERWQATADKRKYFEGAPDLTVEVASPDDSRRQLAEKARSYLAAGARLVWVVWPTRRTVDVHRPDSLPETLTGSDTLDGGDVLPGFTLPVSRIFES